MNTYGVSAPEDEKPALAELVALLEDAQHVEVSAQEGQSLTLPDSARELLAQAASYLLSAYFVAIEPVDEVLTTQEAADLLGVSRPYLIQMLGYEDGQISYHTPGPNGSHRRIMLSDVIAFKEKRAKALGRSGAETLRPRRAKVAAERKAAATMAAENRLELA